MSAASNNGWPSLVTVLAFIGLLLLGPVTAHGELRAALSATEIEELDTVQLVIRDIGGRETHTPDLSSLNQDFEILGVNTSSQYQFINGRAQSWVDYSITLQPKKTGLLTIAPIAIGSKRSAPLQLSVRRLSEQARQKIDNLVFYELALSKDSVYVQSQLLLTRRLIYSEGVQLFGGQLDAPEVESAQVFTLGEGVTSVVTRNGRTMGSFEQRYAIFPERSGTLRIPNESVRASVQMRQGAGIIRKTVSVNTGERLVEVKGIPAEYPSDVPWLPAIAVTASQRFLPSVETPVKIGDTVNQTLTITVYGNTGASITPQDMDLDSTVFKTYAQPARIDNGLTGENLVGKRIESVDLVPLAGGAHALPEPSVTWWNTDTNEVMNTAIQPAVLNVTGSTITETRQPENKVVAQSREPQLGGTVETNANRLDWFAVALAILVIIVFGATRRLRQRSRHSLATARKPDDSHQAPIESARPVKLKLMLETLAKDPPIAVRLVLIAFLIQHYRRPQQEAVELFQTSSPGAGTFMRGLSAACFGQAEFTDALRQQGRQTLLQLTAKTKEKKPDLNQALPSLYPGQ